MREISDQVANKSFILIGGRRIGKTSILRRLFHIQLNKYFEPLLFNCQSMNKREPTKADFLAASSQTWIPQASTNQITAFTDIVNALSGDKPLVFLIDEADKLLAADASAGWPLFEEMQNLAAGGHCQFILAGERELSEAMA